MPMILPEELASKSVIPAIRALIVKRLVVEHGMTQQEAAKLLGVTQPAVSKYLHQKRGAAIRLGGIKEVERATSNIADMVSSQSASDRGHEQNRRNLRVRAKTQVHVRPPQETRTWNGRKFLSYLRTVSKPAITGRGDESEYGH